jgi:hypothetical protein
MTTLPHDISDLHLAPVVLALDARLQELGLLDVNELTQRVALESNLADWTREMRIAGLLEAASHFIDCHGWTLSWDQRGVRVSHDLNTVVLGVGPSLVEYVEGKGRPSAE